MSNVLIASDYTMRINRDLKWNPKKWITRDGNTTVYWTVSDSVPSGFVEDAKYSWRVDANEATAYFSPEVLEGWHSEARGSGQLSRKPVIIYTQKRELTVHEKLALQAPAQSVLPQQLRRSPGTKGQAMAQMVRMETNAELENYKRELGQLKAEHLARVNALKAGYRTKLNELFDAYGVPRFPVVFPD